MMRRHHILILCAALLAVVPLLAFGCSCGHDIDFHLQSWLDAAQQFRHGTLYPHWTFSAAFNAGEPRFIFYPPLSWMFGALLTFVVPVKLLPAVYTLACLAAAGFAMHRLARHFVPPNAAILAAAFYIANPYMLFNAFERTAYAELMAAAWVPLLFLAALRARPTVRGIALPLALLWLTNAPAAVMGSYTLAVIVITRIVYAVVVKPAKNQDAPSALSLPKSPASRTWISSPPLHLALTSIAGTALGLALSAIYLVPAAYERRYVQIAMAIIPGMRFHDNFLFGHTGDIDHDAVLHTASVLALTILIPATAAVLTLLFRTPKPVPLQLPANLSLRPRAASGETCICAATTLTATILTLTILTLCISFLFTPTSTPLWNHLPELPFLQFPWRLLSVLAVVLTLAIALLLRNARLRDAIAIPLALVVVGSLTYSAIHQYRQFCYPEDLPVARAQQFAAHHGVDPTDEYTPNDADNDVLRADDPPYWLSPNPEAFAPGTTPNPQTIIAPPSTPPDTQSAMPAPAGIPFFSNEPIHLTVNVPKSETLILNLRDYSNWNVYLGCPSCRFMRQLDYIQRDDGLIAVRIPAGGPYPLTVAWHRTLDEQLGLIISVLAACIYATLIVFTRRREKDVSLPALTPAAKAH